MLGQAIPFFIIMFITFWFLMVRPHLKEIEKKKSLGLLSKESEIGSALDPFYQEYLTAFSRWAKFFTFGITPAIAGGIVLVLFLWKITQTSDFVLGHSGQAHYEMGKWIIVIGVLLISAIPLLIMAARARKPFDVARENLRDKLKDGLAFAKDNGDTRAVIEIEEKLRKLESTKPYADSQLRNLI